MAIFLHDFFSLFLPKILEKMGILGPNLILNQLSNGVMIPDVKNRVISFSVFFLYGPKVRVCQKGAIFAPKNPIRNNISNKLFHNFL